MHITVIVLLLLALVKQMLKEASHQLIIDNKTYLFSNGVAKLLFRLLPGRIEKANEIWNKK